MCFLFLHELGAHFRREKHYDDARKSGSIEHQTDRHDATDDHIRYDGFRHEAHYQQNR